MRVVLDTNVLVSGIARPRSTPGEVVAAWRDARFDLVVSEALLEELRRVLRYPRVLALLKRNGVSEADIEDLLDILRLKAVLVSTEEVSLPLAPADPKDIQVLQALVASEADYLVTGDKKHLLSLGMPKIVSVSDFSKQLQALESLTQDAKRKER